MKQKITISARAKKLRKRAANDAAEQRAFEAEPTPEIDGINKAMDKLNKFVPPPPVNIAARTYRPEPISAPLAPVDEPEPEKPKRRRSKKWFDENQPEAADGGII